MSFETPPSFYCANEVLVSSSIRMSCIENGNASKCLADVQLLDHGILIVEHSATTTRGCLPGINHLARFVNFNSARCKYAMSLLKLDWMNKRLAIKS